jgi:hypothetical protein
LKKTILLLFTALLLALFFWRLSSRDDVDRSAAGLVPEGAVLFLEFPDLRQTGDRWWASPAGRMLRDSELLSFWQRPLFLLMASEQMEAAAAQLKPLQLQHLFLAAGLSGEGSPDMLLGFRAAAGREATQIALERLRMEMTRQGASKAEPFREGKIDGFRQSWAGADLFTGVVGDWGFVSNSAEGVIDFARRDGGLEESASLADSAVFRRTVEALKQASPDVLAYAQPARVIEELKRFARAQGAVPISSQFEQLEKWESIGLAVRFSEAGVSEKAVAWMTENHDPTGEPRIMDFALPFAPAATLFFTSMVWQPGTQIAALWPTLPPDLQLALGSIGLLPENFDASLGHKLGFSLWWNSGSLLPSVISIMEIKDEEQFRLVATKLGGLLAGEATVDRSNDLSIMTFRAGALGLISPTLAWRDNLAFLALSPGDLAQGLAAGESREGLAASAIWKEATPFLSHANVQATLVDVPGILRRSHATFQPMLGFAAALNPALNRYADWAHLPSADVLVRHLGAVTSRRETLAGGGVLTEIQGPVTWSSLLLALPAGLTDGFAEFENLLDD